MMRKVLMAFLALVILGSSVSMAAAADVALTSVGQSPDATMVKVVLKKMGVAHDHDNMFDATKLGAQKVLIAVIGGSSKGLGAAGIDKDQEKARAVSLVEAAKQKGMKILVMHVGGSGRRGQLTDLFVEAVAPSADAIILVKGGNEDRLFDKMVEGKNVPITVVDTVRATDAPMKSTLSGWGVAVQ